MTVILALGAAPAAQAQRHVGEELDGTSWQVETINGEAVADPARMTVEFAATGDQVSGVAGCNRYIGPFASRGDKVTMGILRQTSVACPPEQAAAEKALIDMLHAAYQADVAGRVLTFVSRQGATMTLVPLPR